MADNITPCVRERESKAGQPQKRRPALGRLVVALLTTAVLHDGCRSATTDAGLTMISTDWVERFCRQTAWNCDHVYRINKSSDGRELRVELRHEMLVVTSTGAVEAYRKPALVAWMNDQRHWVAWSDNLEKGFYVQTGSTQTHVDGYPEFDADARFFAVTDGAEARLYRVNPYRLEAALPSRFGSGSSVFSRPPLVLVAASDDHVRRLEIYTYRDTGKGIDFVSSRVIERPNGGKWSPFYISDVSANGELLSIHEVFDSPVDFMSPVRVYDVASGQLKPVRRGYLPLATLFLPEDMRRRIDNDGPFKQVAATSPSGSNGMH